MFGPWKALVVTVRKYTALPFGRNCAANFGLVMSGLVELGVIEARLPALRIGDIAFPSPLIIGPILATTAVLATNFLVLVAACAGSYWPAVALPLSTTMASTFYPALPP